MKPSAHESNDRQKTVLSKREDKRSINLRWNSRLFFQLGLVFGLLGAFLILESDFELNPKKYTAKKEILIAEPNNFNYKLEEPKPIPVKTAPIVKKPRQTQIPVITDIIFVDKDLTSTINDTPTSTTNSPVIDDGPSTNIPVAPVVPNTPKSILGVEHAPVFPGCDAAASNANKIACMSSKVSSFIIRKFNSDRFTGLDSGKQRITVQFTIDAEGYVTNVRAKAENSELQEEATRVVEKLPKMRPGRQGNDNVDVLYSVPITFLIE